MLSIVTALAQAALEDVQAGGLHWRIRRICTADLAEAGGTFLLALRSRREAEDAKPPEAREAIQGLRFYDAVVAAGVVAVSKDGVAWEDARVVLPPHASSPAASRLAVGDLPPGVVNVLAPRIVSLSTDGEAGAERLRSFLSQ